VTAGDCIKVKGGSSVSSLQTAALPHSCREFCSTVNWTGKEEVLVPNNNRQNCVRACGTVVVKALRY
jgi:hypothetical protein